MKTSLTIFILLSLCSLLAVSFTQEIPDIDPISGGGDDNPDSGPDDNDDDNDNSNDDDDDDDSSKNKVNRF